MKDMGKRIQKRLEELGLTQGQLAKQTGLKQQTISKYATGHCKPSYGAIVVLCKELEVEPNWFFPELYKKSRPCH